MGTPPGPLAGTHVVAATTPSPIPTFRGLGLSSENYSSPGASGGSGGSGMLGSASPAETLSAVSPPSSLSLPEEVEEDHVVRLLRAQIKSYQEQLDLLKPPSPAQ